MRLIKDYSIIQRLMETKIFNSFRRLGTTICLLIMTTLSAFPKGDTPFGVFCNLWQEQNQKSQELTLLTPVPSEVLNQISPLLKKSLKVKTDVKYDLPTNVSGVLTTLLKEKYGKKSNEKNDFYAIQYSMDSSDFENYLNKYPNSKFADEAKARLECFKENELWEIAAKNKTREAYEAFANYCTDHSLVEYEGCEAISKNNHTSASAIAEWYALSDRSKGNNPEIYNAYSKYINKYGNSSIFSGEAKDSMNLNKDRFDWSIAKEENTIGAYKEYIKNHGNGRFAWKAKSLVKEMELWEKAQESDKYEDYCAYYTEYPDGLFAPQATEKIKKEEERIWNDVKKMEGMASDAILLKAYESFVKIYPSGYYASEAQNRITELRLAPYLKNPPSFNSIQSAGHYSHSGYSLVCLGNVDKNTTITVSLTGPTGFSKSIKPGNYEWVRVKNGTYKILVQASNVQNWWGNAVFENRLYADGWATSTSFNGLTISSNRDDAAVKRLISVIKAKAEDEEIKVLQNILKGE